MGQFQVRGTSAQYSNPNQVDQNSKLFADCGDAAAIAAGLRLHAATGVRAETPWSVKTLPGGTTVWGGAMSYPVLLFPQPGTFYTTSPKANPVVFNQDPPVVGKGQPIVVQGSAGSTATAGPVPGTSVVFRSRA